MQSFWFVRLTAEMQFTEIFVSNGGLEHPDFETITRYEPSELVETELITGFEAVALNPLGPVHW